ncbi:TIM barrel protein [Cytophagaceae bacterium YF14B1]|uniref:TIM barrel protein n=1 Tax=Xanthocytophaga flava TaxID=3048013 RepID=A0AAE3QQG1_9BACT|nr:TIM barrel protein [Xanthocytophaga flavus]MDJ1481330.1 TIM barrel protein [Xanthocytophaga flavus]
MIRRDFVKKSLAVAGVTGITLPTQVDDNPLPAKNKFNLKYAPHFGMFENLAGKDLFDQLKVMSELGFTAIEDNGMMGRTPEVQTKIGETLAKYGMTMGVFVIDGGDNWKISLTTGKQEFKDTFLKTCRAAVEVAKRCNAKWMTVVPGFFERHIPIGVQTGNVIDALRQGSEILAPHGLTMVLEPLSDTPELFLRNSDQTYMICRAVNSPACKILFDMYHMQRNEGDIIANLDRTWSEIGYLQIGDNPGRKEPTSGEMNYKNIFKHIHEKGWQGILGMEHGNAKPGKEGEIALFNAYVETDSFLPKPASATSGKTKGKK